MLFPIRIVSIILKVFEDLLGVLGSIDIILLSGTGLKDLSDISEGVVYSLDFTLQLEIDL